MLVDTKAGLTTLAEITVKQRTTVNRIGRPPVYVKALSKPFAAAKVIIRSRVGQHIW